MDIAIIGGRISGMTLIGYLARYYPKHAEYNALLIK